jgi:hypothetical protein
MMATRIVPPPPADLDYQALDTILSHLEHRYGLDPRIDRAYRIVMSARVEVQDDGTTGLVHGDSGRDYWATADGFCECPDAANGHRCKHSLGVLIAAQLAAVAKATAARQQAEAEAARQLYALLTKGHQDHGRALIASGVRPADDPIYQQRDALIQQTRAKLPALSIR